MRYSDELIAAFQNHYTSTFGEEIDSQVAEAELNKLARLVEAIYIKNEKKDNESKGDDL